MRNESFHLNQYCLYQESNFLENLRLMLFASKTSPFKINAAKKKTKNNNNKTPPPKKKKTKKKQNKKTNKQTNKTKQKEKKTNKQANKLNNNNKNCGISRQLNRYSFTIPSVAKMLLLATLEYKSRHKMHTDQK